MITEDHYSDEALTASAGETLSGSQPTGFARTASYLLTIPYFARRAVDSEAWVQADMTGMRTLTGSPVGSAPQGPSPTAVSRLGTTQPRARASQRCHHPLPHDLPQRSRTDVRDH